MKPSNTLSLVGRILITLSVVLACAFLSRAQEKKKSPPPPPPQNSAPAKPAPPKPAATPAPQHHPMQEPPPQHPVQQHPQPQAPAPQPQQQHQVSEPQRPVPGRTPLASAGIKTSTPPPVDPSTTFTPWTSPTTAGRGAKPVIANSATKTAAAASTTSVAAAKKPSNAPATTPLAPSTAAHAGGGKTVTTSAGNRLDFGKGGRLDSVVTNKGTEAHFDHHGQVSTIKTASGTTIVHSPAGGRHIVTEHRDARGHLESRVVSTGPNRGFAEHAVQRGGHEYMHRTYLREGHTYTIVSRGYYYHGAFYYHYVPAYFFPPAYYAWGYSPWGEPIAYAGWGWNDSPWYGWSGYYFAPYPVYPSAAFWLADFVIAENLKAAYEAQAAANAAAANAEAAAADANAAAANADAAAANANAAAAQQASQGGAAALTPEVKEMIAEEVKAQLAAEQAASQIASATDPSQQSIADSYRMPAALDPNRRVFIVSSSLEVSVNDQPCILRPGDVLNRTETAPDSDNTVAVYVLKSQKSDCAAGTTPRIQVADLQEMHNHFREQMDAGLKTLSDNQGKNGLPSAPAGASPRQNADGTAAPDDAAAIAAQLHQQQQEAAQAETEIQKAASAGGPGGKP